MGKRSNMPDRDANLLLTSGLILLISLILAAMAYFSITLGIVNPPGTSSAPNRVGGTNQTGTGIANPGGNRRGFSVAMTFTIVYTVEKHRRAHTCKHEH